MKSFVQVVRDVNRIQGLVQQKKALKAVVAKKSAAKVILDMDKGRTRAAPNFLFRPAPAPTRHIVGRANSIASQGTKKSASIQSRKNVSLSSNLNRRKGSTAVPKKGPPQLQKIATQKVKTRMKVEGQVANQNHQKRLHQRTQNLLSRGQAPFPG